MQYTHPNLKLSQSLASLQLLPMNKPRPFLTALCFVLFVAVFVSSNVRPSGMDCRATGGVEPAALRRLADGVRHALQVVSNPGDVS